MLQTFAKTVMEVRLVFTVLLFYVFISVCTYVCVCGTKYSQWLGLYHAPVLWWHAQWQKPEHFSSH